MPISVTNTARQSKRSCRTPPMIGAIVGASGVAIVM